MKFICAILCCWVGILSITIGKLIHVVSFKEWTEVEAFRNLWMFWIAGFSFIIASILIMKIKEKE